MPRLLQNLKIREVSSVSRGAGKGVKVMLMKMRDGTALTPQHNETLDKSLERMFEVSAEHGVPPENVTKARKALSASIAEIEKNVTAEDQQTAIEKSLSQCVDYLTGLVPVAKAEAFLAAVAAFSKKDPAMTPEQLQKMIDDAVGKVVAPLQKSLTDSTALISKQADEIALLKMSEPHRDYAIWLKSEEGVAALGETADKVGEFVKKFVAADVAGRDKVIKAFPPKKKGTKPDPDADANLDDAVAKALENNPVMKTLAKENADLKKQLGTITDAGAVAEFAKRAKDLGFPEAQGEVMRKAYAGDAEAIKKHEEFLKGVSNQAATGIIFKEFGNGGGDAGGATAYDVIKAKADELRKTEAGSKLSPQQARAKIMMDPMNKELVDRNKAEENARRRAA